MILVTGFGPFGEVSDNPSARLARSLHGARVRGRTVVGEVLDVSYARAPARTLSLVRQLEPALVLGTGVAVSRPEAWVERFGKGLPPVGHDVDGRCPERLEGDYASPVAVRLAEALKVGVSEDAGRYVCNAWLCRVGLGTRVPVGFLHVPAVGIEPDRLLKALGQLLPGS